MSAIALDNASVEAVAQRVAELIRGEDVSPELVDASEVARRFGVSRDYVYEHSADLGAVKLGDGPKARLRFNPATVAERLNAPKPSPPKAPRRHRRRASDIELLPIRRPGP